MIYVYAGVDLASTSDWLRSTADEFFKVCSARVDASSFLRALQCSLSARGISLSGVLQPVKNDHPHCLANWNIGDQGYTAKLTSISS